MYSMDKVVLEVTETDAVTKATTTAALRPIDALYLIPLFNFSDDTHRSNSYSVFPYFQQPCRYCVSMLVPYSSSPVFAAIVAAVILLVAILVQ